MRSIRRHLEELPMDGNKRSLGVVIGTAAVRAYQRVWSNGRNVCRHPHPNNCSTLGIKAIGNHGLIIGTVLIVALQLSPLGGLFGSNKNRQGANAQSQPKPHSICA